MKKIVLVCAALIVSLTMFGHAAKKVELSYDKTTGELTVTVTHPVKNVKTHYIDKLSISINGKQVTEKTFTEQSSLEKHTFVIPLEEAKTGDTIEVTTNCNKMGKRGSSITIE